MTLSLSLDKSYFFGHRLELTKDVTDWFQLGQSMSANLSNPCIHTFFIENMARALSALYLYVSIHARWLFRVQFETAKMLTLLIGLLIS